MAKDAIKMKGKVVKVHSTTQFEIKLDENDLMIQGVISGKMKKHRIKILPGDGVDVEISPYDLTKGRIVYRHK